ncbi:hypothetical protein CsatB_022897 [Cannabis sativa]
MITPPILRPDTVKRSLHSSFANSKKQGKVQITMDDIADEISYWSSATVCYVLGANPPLSVLEGFARRIWKGKVDKVGMISYGIFLIRFTSIAERDEILAGGYIFFNKRPVIMKAWDPNLNLKKEDIRIVPIWIQLEDLELKYWGQKSLFKIVGQLGKPIMEDAITKERDKLTFPRVLIEVSMQQEFPDLIYFDNEHGNEVSVAVKYEWKPIVCKHCQGMGHASEDCRRKEGKRQEWVVKDKSKTSEMGAKLQKHNGDFQPVTKGWKPKNKEAVPDTHLSNTFKALELNDDNAEMEEQKELNQDVSSKGGGGGGEPPLLNG